MVRTPGYDKSGLKKGTWTPEEDKKLSEYVTRYGCWNWRQLPKYAGLARCGKSCRLRWMNYLRPNIKRGNYNKEEEDIIVRLHEKLGNKWSAIAAQLPGRTDNEIKNHWHTSLKKQVTQITTSDETLTTNDFSQCSSHESEVETITHKMNEPSCSMEASYCPQQPQVELLDDFWSEPFLSEISMMQNSDFSVEADEGMMYPTGVLSPPHSTDFFDEDQFGRYDSFFSSF